MTTIDTVTAESTDLELHVELCAQRYQELDARLTSVETKLDKLSETVNSLKNDLVKTLIASAGSIIVAIIGALTIVVSHIK
jgi:chromosome segregation ATPase